MRLVPRGGDFGLMLRVLLLARSYWLLILLFFVVSMLATPLTLLTPISLKIVADVLVDKQAVPAFLSPLIPATISSSETRLIAFAAVLFVVVAFLRQAQELARTLLYTYIGERLTLKFRSRLFSQVQRMSLTYHDSQGTADSVYRIQYDAMAIQSLAIDGLIPFLAASCTLFAMVYVVLAIDWQLGVAALAAGPVLLVLTRMYQTRLRQRARAVKRLESSAMGVIQEVLGALRVVKAFGQEEREEERFHQRAEDGVQARVGLSAVEGIFGLMIGLTTAVVSAVVLYIGALHVRSGVLTLGELLLVMGYLAQLYDPLRSASKRVGKMQSSMASAERAFQLLDQAPDVEERPDAMELERARGEIGFRDLSFGYEAKSPVLQGVWLHLWPGERLGVYGATGAGKTTLISLLTRLYDPNQGSITLDGVDLREYKVAGLRKQFAVVLQEPVLFSTTIAENISYACAGATFEEIVAAAEAAGAHDFITALPDGYDTIVGERGMRLSGGERQRVALARAFLKDAPILVLDEPTSSVDHRTEATIIAAMERLMAGRTTIMIAHRLETLSKCDRWLELLPGGKTKATSEPPSRTTTVDTSRYSPGREELHPAARAWAQGNEGQATLERGLEHVDEPAVGLSLSSSARGASMPQERSEPAARRAAGRPAGAGPNGHPMRAVARREALEHPAAEAWARLGVGETPPHLIECLHQTKKSLVCRLRGAGPGGGDVVAKRGGETLRAELEIYRAVLPNLPVLVPDCYGLVEDREGVNWLFVEDAGEVVYSPENRDHPPLAARWLARLHTSAAKSPLAAALPDRGIAHYLGHLRAGRETMLQARANPALRKEDVAVLDTLASLCTAIESRWQDVEWSCRGMPETLVHGDFVPKNVRVRAGEDGLTLSVFDWEMAGWGVPAVDLAQVDPVLYWRFVRDYWPDLSMRTVIQLARGGKLLGHLAAINWATQWLKYRWVERPMGWLRLYRDELAAAVELLGEAK